VTNQSQAVAVPIAPKWLPIGTAPKDGTDILLHFDGRVPVVAAWFRDGWAPMDLNGAHLPGEPTHWMPLPQAPSDQEGLRQPDSESSLVAENERLKEQIAYILDKLMPAVAQDRDALRTQLAEAQKDAQRIDRLASAGDVSIGMVWDCPHDGEYRVDADGARDLQGYGKTLREAIDAALTPKEQAGC